MPKGNLYLPADYKPAKVYDSASFQMVNLEEAESFETLLPVLSNGLRGNPLVVIGSVPQDLQGPLLNLLKKVPVDSRSNVSKYMRELSDDELSALTFPREAQQDIVSISKLREQLDMVLGDIFPDEPTPTDEPTPDPAPTPSNVEPSNT